MLHSTDLSRHVGPFLGERLYEALISCDIYYVAVSEQKLSELDDALAELAEDDDEVSAVLRRFDRSEPSDLAAVDQDLEAIADGANIPVVGAPVAPVIHAPVDVDIQESHPEHAQPEFAQDDWDGENTEVEIIDPSDDFVLLVDDGDLEDFKEVTERAPMVSMPPPLPGKKVAQAQSEEDSGDDDEDEGFFKKLFGSRRSSNRP